jgi:hypothetical protein
VGLYYLAAHAHTRSRGEEVQKKTVVGCACIHSGLCTTTPLHPTSQIVYDVRRERERERSSVVSVSRRVCGWCNERYVLPCAADYLQAVGDRRHVGNLPHKPSDLAVTGVVSKLYLCLLPVSRMQVELWGFTISLHTRIRRSAEERVGAHDTHSSQCTTPRHLSLPSQIVYIVCRRFYYGALLFCTTHTKKKQAQKKAVIGVGIHYTHSGVCTTTPLTSLCPLTLYAEILLLLVFVQIII